MPLERGRVGTGSVLALDAIGPQDAFLLNDNMADSKWDPTYTQTTNFAITQRSIPLPSSAWIDHEITVELVPTTSGDLISNLHLRCSLPALPAGNVYTDQIGRAIFQQVDFMIDGQVIESLNDDWYILRDQLFLDADEKNAMIKAVNGGYAEGTLSQLAQTPQIDMIIPLDFFFCRRHSRYKKHRERLDKPYFPMCAIYNQRIYLKIKFQKWNWFSNSIAEVRSGLVNLTSPVVLDNLMKTTLTVSPVSNFLPGMYISGLPIFESRLLINSVDTANNTVTVTSTVPVSPVFYPLTFGFSQVNKTLTIPSSTIFAGTTSTFTVSDTTGIYIGMLMSGVYDYSKNLYFTGKVVVTSNTVSTVTVQYDYQEPRLNNKGETMPVQFIDAAQRSFNQNFSGPIPAGVSYTFTVTAPLTSPIQTGMIVTGLPGIVGTATVTNVTGQSVTVSYSNQTPSTTPWNFPVTVANQTDFVDTPQLIIEEIQLTEEERQYVRTTPRRLIVNRAVKKPPLFLDQGTSGQISIGIGASFPVTFMAWFIRRSDFETATRYVDSRYSYGYTTKYINSATPITFFNGVKLNYIDLINNAQITLSGNDILNKIAGGLYFTMKQPFDHSLSIPTKSIYVYAFGLNPKEYNQGGFLDFSPLNAATTTLALEFNPDYASEIAQSFSLYVFYYGYTIIEIKDGFGRLVFV